VDEQTWHDLITGTHYQCSGAWIEALQQQLIKEINVKLQSIQNVKEAADCVARFWRHEFYERLFPLRFGLGLDEAQRFAAAPLLPAEQAVVKLDAWPTPGVRRHFLDGAAWPPILPDDERGEQGWLLVDRLLIEAMLFNVLLATQSQVDEETRQAARLAALTYPFQAALRANPVMQGKVDEISTLFNGAAVKNAPSPTRARITQLLPGALPAVGLVVFAAQRIKQYVFESAGLNEIRGASTLLDDTTDILQGMVDEEIGPEAVLRSAGATLIFVAPATDRLAEWPAQLRRTFFEATEVAFPAAAVHTASVDDMLGNFGETLEVLFAKMGEDRAQAQLPNQITYPFEERCNLCKSRAANGWYPGPGDAVPDPVCTACLKKRKLGRKKRAGKVYTVLEDLGLVAKGAYPKTLAPLGIKTPTDDEGWLAQDLDNLVYHGTRRKLIGMVYGDGDNFGTVSQRITDLALSLQWSARVEYTTRAAAALALGRATQQAAQLRGWQAGADPAPVLDKVPFQVLALGGDDISLFAWAPVAIYFAAEFTALTNRELAVSSIQRLNPEAHLHFSLGVLLTDENTPVVKSVNFTEKQLLKWAKQANKDQGFEQGAITALFAERADKMPSDLAEYRREVYLLGDKRFQFCTTLRPYTAAQLQALLTVAQSVRKEHLGRLERLVSAFYGARQGVYAGMLHYAYQKARSARSRDGTEDGGSAGEGWIQAVERQLAEAMKLAPQPDPQPLLIFYPTEEGSKQKRHLFGLAHETPDDKLALKLRYSPLLDLLELAKLMV